MAGKTTTPLRVYKAIRVLYALGASRRQIARQIGVSVWTVRKAIEPDFADRENARHRAAHGEVYPKRRSKPEFLRYQAEYGRRPERLEQVRLKMDKLRSQRRTNVTASPSAQPTIADIGAFLINDPALADMSIWDFARMMRRLAPTASPGCETLQVRSTTPTWDHLSRPAIQPTVETQDS